MTPRDIAALGAVRIREGRERRVRAYYTTMYGFGQVGYWADGDGPGRVVLGRERRAHTDRRSTVSPRAAELAAEVERLRGMVDAAIEAACAPIIADRDRLTRLLADAHRLLAVAKPDHEAIARRDAELARGFAEVQRKSR